MNQLAKEIAKNLNFDLDPIYVKDRPNEVKFATCSSNKARMLLGYETKTTFAQGIKKMVDYIKSIGTKDFRYNYEIEINNEHTPETWKNRLM